MSQNASGENPPSNPLVNMEVVDKKNFDNITCHNKVQELNSQMPVQIFNILTNSKENKLRGGANIITTIEERHRLRADRISYVIQSEMFYNDYFKKIQDILKNILNKDNLTNLEKHDKSSICNSIHSIASEYYKLKQECYLNYIGELVRANNAPDQNKNMNDTITTHIYKDILTGKLYELEKKIEQKSKGGKKCKKNQKESLIKNNQQI